jgi:RNA polymerase sigma-70 factor, ECF subfamily
VVAIVMENPVTEAAVGPSFAEIFRDNVRFVWRAVANFGVPERDVEDVCQDVFVVVHRRLGEGAAPEHLRAWLYGICWRTASAYRRRRYRKNEFPTAEVDAGATDAGAVSAALENRRRLAELDAALDGLKENQRMVFVLYEVEELTMKEVSEALGCSINTAFSRLYAARKSVARALGLRVPAEAWKR